MNSFPRPATLRVLALAAVVAALAASANPASARVGEKLDDLKKRFGRPQTQPKKDVAVWLIEEREGPLLYTVTLNDKNISIAEGLKPMRQSPLPEELAKSFLEEQLSTFPDSKSVRTVKPGESYTFGGETFVCAEHEVVAVDDVNGLLVIWTRGPAKSVMAVTHQMLDRTKPPPAPTHVPAPASNAKPGEPADKKVEAGTPR